MIQYVHMELNLEIPKQKQVSTRRSHVGLKFREDATIALIWKITLYGEETLTLRN